MLLTKNQISTLIRERGRAIATVDIRTLPKIIQKCRVKNYMGNQNVKCSAVLCTNNMAEIKNSLTDEM